MQITTFIFQIAVISISGLIIVFTIHRLLKEELSKYFPLNAATKTATNAAQLLPLRLQAHERLVVFIDRINPANLLLRLHQPGATAGDLQAVILHEIRTEFQHNVTQQLYISTDNWNVIKKIKDDTIAMVNNAVSTLPQDASAADLSRKILNHLAGMEHNPYELTLEVLKKDIHQMFNDER